MIVRAITLFYNPPSWDVGSITSDLSSILKEYTEVLARKLDKPLLKGGKRLSFPMLPGDMIEKVSIPYLIRKIEEIACGNGVDFVANLHISEDNIGNIKIDDVAKVLTKTKASFISYNINLKSDRKDIDRVIDSYIQLLRISISQGFWKELARVALALNGPILSPYYPVSVNTMKSNGIAIAALYTDLFKKTLLKKTVDVIDYIAKYFKLYNEIGKTIANTLNVEYFGFDFSLSPWMEYSVVEIVEKFMNGKELGDHGTLHTIYYLNMMLWRAAEKANIKKVGYCELMLPVAEDNILKLRVAKGKVKTKDLISYTIVCVAGLDMIYFPMEDLKYVKPIIEDLIAICEVKKRSIGIRLIPTSARPFEVIHTDEFGGVPVMSLTSR